MSLRTEQGKQKLNRNSASVTNTSCISSYVYNIIYWREPENIDELKLRNVAYFYFNKL